MDYKQFEQLNIFGKGEKNTAYSKYFIGMSYLNPLNAPQKGMPFLANVTFEPACRNNWHIHRATSGGGQMLICAAGSGWYARPSGASPSPTRNTKNSKPTKI